MFKLTKLVVAGLAIVMFCSVTTSNLSKVHASEMTVIKDEQTNFEYIL